MDIPYRDDILVNNLPAIKETKIYEKFTVVYPYSAYIQENAAQEVSVGESGETLEAGIGERNSSKTQPSEGKDLVVFVNQTRVVLKGKERYRVVDILDFYPFDVSVSHGNTVVIRVDGEKADFTSEITEGCSVDLYWE